MLGRRGDTVLQVSPSMLRWRSSVQHGTNPAGINLQLSICCHKPEAFELCMNVFFRLMMQAHGSVLCSWNQMCVTAFQNAKTGVQECTSMQKVLKGGQSFKSMHRTACIARPAVLRILSKTSTGQHPKVAVQHTQSCRQTGIVWCYRSCTRQLASKQSE